MPRNVLVSDIIAGARERANDKNARLADDPTMIKYVETAYGKYYQLLADADPAYYQIDTTLSTAIGNKLYPLPADWFGTMHVGRRSGSFDVRLSRIPADEVLDYSVNGQPCYYQIESGQIGFYPTPDSAYTMRHIYVPTWTKITATSQSIDGLMGNEELIELELAIRLKGKEESEKSDLVAERQMAVERLAKLAFQRNIIDSQVVGSKFVDDDVILHDKYRNLYDPW